MKCAILADLHLPDREDTFKEKLLDLTLVSLRNEGVEMIISAGDMTGFGTVPAAERLARKLRDTGIAFLLTPGNAEYRSVAIDGIMLEGERATSGKRISVPPVS